MVRHYAKSKRISRLEIEKFLSFYETQTHAAKALGVTRSYLSQVVNSIVPISEPIAIRMERATRGAVSAARLLNVDSLSIPIYDNFSDHFKEGYIYPMADGLGVDRDQYYLKYTHYDVKKILEKDVESIHPNDLKLLSILYIESYDYLNKMLKIYL